MRFLLPLVFVPLAACVSVGTYQRYSSGSVGCPPNEIGISDQSERFVGSTWTATCRGKRFYCSVPAGGGSATCTPEREPLGGEMR